jgi:hypothetical protein
VPISDAVKWTAGVEYSGALGFAGTTFTTVHVGNIPAMALNSNPILYVGWVSVLGDQGGGTYTPTLTLADSTVIPIGYIGNFQLSAAGAQNGGLYVAKIQGDLQQGGSLDFTFRLVNVLGAPTVTRNNGVVIGVLVDGSIIPTYTRDGGYGDHGNVGRGPLVGQPGDHPVGLGSFGPGALSDPTTWPVMSWAARTENVPYIRVGYTALELTEWYTAGFFSSSAQACSVAMVLMEPGTPFDPNVQWDLGSDVTIGPWVVARNWILTNYTTVIRRGRSYAQVVG